MPAAAGASRVWRRYHGRRDGRCCPGVRDHGLLHLHEDGGDHQAQGGRRGPEVPGTWATFMDIYRREGIRGINKGVNAVAIRQMTNWGSRFGLEPSRRAGHPQISRARRTARS